MMTRTPSLRLFPWLLACSVRLATASYVINLVPNQNEKECFLIRLPDHESIVSGNYDCIDDEIDGSYATVWLEEKPGGKIVWQSEEGEEEDTFQLTLPASKRYALCFEFRDISDDPFEDEEIPIGFNLRVQAAVARALPEEDEGPDAKRALDLVESAIDIENDWENLLDHFDFLRNREAVHSELTAQIFQRVMGWTIVEAVLVVSMAFCQVMYWKKFFEKRRYL